MSKTNRKQSTAAIIAQINANHPADVTCKCEFCSLPVIVRPSDPGFESARTYGYAVCSAPVCQRMAGK